MSNKSVHFWCDNLVVVQIINSLMFQSPRVKALVREFMMICLRHSIFFKLGMFQGSRMGSLMLYLVNRLRDFVSLLQTLTHLQFISQQKYSVLES